MTCAIRHDNAISESIFFRNAKVGLELPSNGGTVVALSDLNSDGHPELILGNSFNNDSRHLNSYIYWGGAEGFSSKHRTELPTVGVSGIGVADLNRDGHPDLIFANNGDGTLETGRSFIYWGAYDGYRREKRTDLETHHATGCTVADFNRDGYPDIAFTNGEAHEYVWLASKVTQSAYIYWGSAKGFEKQRRSELPVHDATGVSTGDLNGDGWLDLAITNFKQDSSLSTASFVYWGSGNGFSAAHRTELPTQGAKGSCIADLNRDGIADLAIANFGSRYIGSQEPYAMGKEINSYVYWGSRSGLSAQNHSELPTAGGSACSSADLNGDGWLDLSFANYADEGSFNTHSFTYWGGQDGFSASRRTTFPTRGTTSVASYLSSDGTSLLAFANSLSGRPMEDIPSFIYWGNPAHIYSTQGQSRLASVGGYGAAIADFNLDDFPDLVIANSHENDPTGTAGLSLFWGSKEGVSEQRREELPAAGSISVATADFNRDGYLDIVSSDVFSNTVGIFWGSAKGFSKDNRWSAPVSAPRFLNYADLNRDGWLDLIIPSTTGDTLIFWGSKQGFQKRNVTALPSVAPVASKAADLNSDGYLDLVICNFWDPETHSGYINSYIYWGSANGFTARLRTELPSIGAHAAVVGDLNRDGLLDIVFCNYHGPVTRSIDSYVYWGQKDGVYSVAHRTGIPTDSSVAGMIYDFNQDGVEDLFMMNHLIHGDHHVDSTLYWGGKTGLDPQRAIHFPGLGPHGFVALDPGNMFHRKLEHEYISCPFDAGQAVRFVGLKAETATPGRSSITFSVRMADTREGLASAPWQKARQSQGSARWLQYRAGFQTPNLADAPNVSLVEVYYEP